MNASGLTTYSTEPQIIDFFSFITFKGIAKTILINVSFRFTQYFRFQRFNRFLIFYTGTVSFQLRFSSERT